MTGAPDAGASPILAVVIVEIFVFILILVVEVLVLVLVFVEVLVFLFVLVFVFELLFLLFIVERFVERLARAVGGLFPATRADPILNGCAARSTRGAST